MPSALADLAGVSRVQLPTEPPFPEIQSGHAAVYLLDASTGLEDRLLRAWLARCGSEGTILNLRPSRIRRPGRKSDPGVGKLIDDGNPRWVVPLRVVWMPTERQGRRSVSWWDVLKLGDPRDPRWFRDYLILRLFPDRVRIVVGRGASAAAMAKARVNSAQDVDAREFVTRRAWRALDRAERDERGNRYKIPRFVAEDLTSRPPFRAGAITHGAECGLSEPRALARARYYVSEMAATHSPFLIDLIANVIHWVVRQGYRAIHYDRQAVERIAQLGSDHPLVFLPSHKSNLDRLSLQFMLWENDLPPNHTAGGINMNFFPVGPLVRRTGVFFIRRSFKGNELYKFVVRAYLDYLVEKRFPLEWYMEGGRSRSGKLRPPRYGMLSWVVGSMVRGKSDDLYLLPISIAYDQIQEVGAYVTEATGGHKEKETFAWALKFARSLRQRYGDIHIRFAEPISVANSLTGADLDDADPIEIQKLAFEVMYRMSMVTPVTPTALVSTVLLAARGEARDIDTIAAECRDLVSYIDSGRFPTTTDLPTRAEDVLSAIGLMAAHGLVSSVSAAGRTAYWMEEGQKHRASYYANTVVHYFVPRGLAEIAMSGPDLDSFWKDLLDLRDLLKFEFFFADKDEFRKRVAQELSEEVVGWEDIVESGNGSSISLSPTTVDFAVLPLLEGYLVVADELAALDEPFDEKAFVAACIGRGRLYRLEGEITSDESVSESMFSGAILLARNRGLLTDEATRNERKRFAEEIRRYRQAALESLKNAHDR